MGVLRGVAIFKVDCSHSHVVGALPDAYFGLDQVLGTEQLRGLGILCLNEDLVVVVGSPEGLIRHVVPLERSTLATQDESGWSSVFDFGFFDY